MPLIRNAAASASVCPTCGNSDFFASHISATMQSMVTPSAVCTSEGGKASPTSAPTMELADASRASGNARRKSASPARSRPGPAATALASATSKPAPRTKSRWNGKKPLTIGTNNTPPPTPAGTAIMPSTKHITNSASGHSHHTISAAGASAAHAMTGQQAVINREIMPTMRQVMRLLIFIFHKLAAIASDSARQSRIVTGAADCACRHLVACPSHFP